MTSTRSRLRTSLADDKPLVAPGVYNALFARLVEECGFSAVYLSGAGVANSLLGAPDVGLTTLSETVALTDLIRQAVDIPVIVDADTGYGGINNVARTVRLLERAGADAIQLEDQRFPKRCGHFEGKEVVELPEMLERIAAALDTRTDSEMQLIARTDAAQSLGLNGAIDRAKAYAEAGADMLFVEAPQSIEELATIGRELGHLPLIANMVEFGKTPLIPAEQLCDLGFRLIIFPGAIMRRTVHAAIEMLGVLRDEGSTESLLPKMSTFSQVNSIVGREGLEAWEMKISSIGHRSAGPRAQQL
jgi:2-methylisocitrate lyase-like PEP mutase family enzyme